MFGDDTSKSQSNAQADDATASDVKKHATAKDQDKSETVHVFRDWAAI